jgi:hypothetical protein
MLIGISLFEETFIGTSYCFHLYRLLLIQTALQALYEWMVS